MRQSDFQTIRERRASVGGGIARGRRMRKRWGLGLTGMLVGLLGSGVALAAEDGGKLSPEVVEFFEAKIRPVLAQECYECHSTRGKSKGGLLLDSRAGWQAGGDSGAAIVPGDPAGSLLMHTIRHEDADLKMPKAGAKLDEAVLRDFEKWIALGAPDPRDAPPTDAELAEDASWEAVMERRKAWWSFQPITEPEVPEIALTSVDSQDGGKTSRTAGQRTGHPIDRFVQARLTKEGLTQAKQADARTLIRRASFVLTGLPPAPERVEAFVKESAENPDGAFSALVDEFLASPRFGEHWARHWMDWIRYAESHGSEGDPAIPNAYYYRDYLIRAFNEDVTYDQMVREAVAGDLLEKPRVNAALGLNESAIGAAHWRMVFHGFTPTDALDEKVRFTDDQINVFSKAFQALTVSCARCHDHKFDAISQADYYALFGILGSTRPALIDAEAPGLAETNKEDLLALKGKIREALVAEWKKGAQRVASRLLKPDQGLQSAIDRAKKESGDILYAWRAMRKDVDAEKAGEVTAYWKGEAEAWRKQQNEEAGLRAALAEEGRRLDLSQPGEYAKWYRDGAGLPEAPSAAGDFAIEVEGDALVRRIYPSGVYTNLVSDKHRAVLSSAHFPLESKLDLWLRVTGDGGPVVRYAVQNYPRRGTVYPVNYLNKGKWEWLKYDLSYWEGDEIHLELTTAADSAALAKLSEERSYFGIREAVLLPAGAKPPMKDPLDWLSPLFGEGVSEAAGGEAVPESLEAVAARYQAAVVVSVEAWAANQMTDAQALFLDSALKSGLLPNLKQDVAEDATFAMVENYRALEDAIPAPKRVPGVLEADARDQALFVRGDHKKPAGPVPRRFLEAIDDTPYETVLSGRRELAEDLLRADNPFTRRVIVNRLWHYLFGRGLVPTVDNFGRLGEKPSHPELLDYLAVHFSEVDGWSLKEAIRFMMTSQTWKQSSDVSPDASLTDPDNVLLSHANTRRLGAEAIRDNLLAVSGSLESGMYGPATRVKETTGRRSVYLAVIRNDLSPFLEVFDAPTPFATKGRRDVTNVPAQSLTLLNDPFVIAQAETWATRLTSEESLPDDSARVRAMFERALARDPRPEELEAALGLVKHFRSAYGTVRRVRQDLEGELQQRRESYSAILDPARERLMTRKALRASREIADGIEHVAGPKPVAYWDFEDGLTDRMGGLEARAYGNARVEGGALVVDGESFAASQPLSYDLEEKTLEAWVQLDDLEQRGGGVLTVQDLRGGVFDSIVIGERRPKRWISGSNRFERTDDFDGVDEEEAAVTPVHIAITYQKDGTIQAYRNGEPYGQPYVSKGPMRFDAGAAQVVFGLRHGTAAVGNKPLKGRILEAKLYDWALPVEAVRASFRKDDLFVTQDELRDSLTDGKRAELSRLESEIERLKEELEKMGGPGADPAPGKEWADLGHAIFNLKEFIYLR